MRARTTLLSTLVLMTFLGRPAFAASSDGIARGIVNAVNPCGPSCTEVEVQDLSFSPPFYIDRIQFVGGLQPSGAAIQCGMSVTISYLPRISSGTGSGSDLYYLQATGDKLSVACPIGQTCGCT